MDKRTKHTDETGREEIVPWLFADIKARAENEGRILTDDEIQAEVKLIEGDIEDRITNITDSFVGEIPLNKYPKVFPKDKYMEHPDTCPFCDKTTEGDSSYSYEGGGTLTHTMFCTECNKQWMNIYNLADVHPYNEKTKEYEEIT